MENGFLIKFFWRDGQHVMTVNDQEFILHPWVGVQMESWIKVPKIWATTAINRTNEDRSLNHWLKDQGESKSLNPNKGPGSKVKGLDY